jgi:hypothetical protein
MESNAVSRPSSPLHIRLSNASWHGIVSDITYSAPAS